MRRMETLQMQANRRDFCTQALTVSAAAAGIPITALGAPAATPPPRADAAVRWGLRRAGSAAPAAR